MPQRGREDPKDKLSRLKLNLRRTANGSNRLLIVWEAPGRSVKFQNGSGQTLREDRNGASCRI